jgi:hypothetical protein
MGTSSVPMAPAMCAYGVPSSVLVVLFLMLPWMYRPFQLSMNPLCVRVRARARSSERALVRARHGIRAHDSGCGNEFR